MEKKRLTYRSIDGLLLVGDLTLPSRSRHVCVMVHGITSNRYEDGLYPATAAKLAANNIASLAFDFRGHGESEGLQQDLTLAGLTNDVLESVRVAQTETETRSYSIMAASFGGGVSVKAGYQRQDGLVCITLLNPRLDYRPWVVDPSIWKNGRLSADAEIRLLSDGFLHHRDFNMGRGLINEILQYSPGEELSQLPCDILVIHGTDDTVIPVSESRLRYNANGRGRLLEIKGRTPQFCRFSLAVAQC